MPEPLYLSIPLEEFERLHAEIKRLQARVRELETQVRGYEWGLSNAQAEEHNINAPES